LSLIEKRYLIVVV